MGYTKVIQSGDYIELYQYKKPRYDDISQHERTPRRNSRKSLAYYMANPSKVFRSDSSIKRGKAAFFRLVATNLQGDEKPGLITLTLTQEFCITLGYKFLREFFKRLKKVKGDHIRYIAVPEWQPVSGFLHFHCLVWGLAEDDKVWQENERDRRNYQRLWLRGYADVCPGYDSSLALAGYMAKYMAESSDDKRLFNLRSYTTSGNIKRPLSAASNAMDDYLDMIIPTDAALQKIQSYETMWLGRCDYKQYKRIDA